MPLSHDEAAAEDAVRSALFDTMRGTGYLPESVVLLTDVVVVYGCIDSEGDQGFGFVQKPHVAATRHIRADHIGPAAGHFINCVQGQQV